MTTVQRAGFEGSDEGVIDRILTAIAEKTDTDPLEFDRPIYDVIDPDALDALFRRNGSLKLVEFSYLGHRVRVSGDEEITVETERL